MINVIEIVGEKDSNIHFDCSIRGKRRRVIVTEEAIERHSGLSSMSYTQLRMYLTENQTAFVAAADRILDSVISGSADQIWVTEARLG